MTVLLKGITWNHSRGFVSVVATAQRFEEMNPGVRIVWEKRSLQEFADAPVQRLAENYDLLIIDHPWAGFAVDKGVFVPLEQHLSAEFLADQAANSVGKSHESYNFDGRQTALAVDAATPTRTVRLGDSTINNKQMDMSRIDATLAPGAVEVWRVRNDDGKPHNLHIHGVSFQVRRVGGAPPPAHLSGWKDTVYIAPEREYELVVRFPTYPDPTIPYMYHCHVLYHEDQGMMAQFVVVAPGQAAQSPSAHHHHHG